MNGYQTHYRLFYNELSQKLIKLGFKVDSIGFNYWIRAIQVFQKEGWRNSFTMQDIYEQIALFFKTTPSRVERALRTASSVAKYHIREMYNYKGKLSNKPILILLTKYNITINKAELDKHIPRID